MAGLTMRASGALRHVEHLATLGLDPHVAIPEMLRTLGTSAAPGTSASFYWVGADGTVEDACGGRPDSALPSVVPATNGFQLRLLVERRTVAIVAVARAAALGERERRLFRAALPALQRAMTQRPFGHDRFDDMPEQTAVLVADAGGRLLSADERALLLVAEMDGHPLVGSAIAMLRPGDRLPPFIADACRRARASTVERVSRWGAFRAQAFAQVADAAGPQQHVVVLSKYLPRQVALMRTLERMDLSPRERQVAFQLGNGADAVTGAAALGVSITTWRSYVKRVYLRLDVRDRFDLLSRLNVRLAA